MNSSLLKSSASFLVSFSLSFASVLLFHIPYSVTAQQTVGVFEHSEDAFPGYTLFAPISSNTTYLIDNCGRYINSWESEYRPGMAAYLLENGDMVRAARIPSNFPNGGTGGKIEWYNWEGDLVWSFIYSSDTFHQHHDFEVLPNGNVLILAWEKITASEAVANGRNPNLVNPNNGLWPEHIVEVEPEGTEGGTIVWEWHLIDHVVQDFDPAKANFGVVSEHPELININFAASSNGGGGGGGADWIHANSVDYNPQLDQIIISSRTFNEFWVIDHSTTTQEAAGHTGGNAGKGGDILYRWGNPRAYNRGSNEDQQLFGQHDANWIPAGYPDEGKIMVFNNGIGRPGGNHSSIEVVAPPIDSIGNYFIDTVAPFEPLSPSWSYQSDPVFDFYSSNVSGAHRLPNGNTLICEGNKGNYIEVDQSGNIVWRYINPVIHTGPVPQGQNANQNSTFRCYRYGEDYPAFIDKDLTPGLPIEIDPLATPCLLDGPVDVDNSLAELNEQLRIYPNPVSDFLTIENLSDKAIRSVELWDSRGRFMQIIENGVVDEVPNGLYVVKVNLENEQAVLKKILIHHY